MTRKFVRTLMIAALMAAAWPLSARAQTAGGPTGWDAPAPAQGPEEKPPVTFRLDDWFAEKHEVYGFGGYGGPLAMYLQLDLSALDPMTDGRGLDRFNSNLLLIGGLGGMVLHPPNWPGYLCLGGVGFGMSQSVHQTVNGDARSARMSLVGGGVFAEYRQPLVTSLDLVAGVMVGAGALSFSADGDDLGLVEDDDWSANINFALAYPYLGLSWELTKWMRLEASGGYIFMDPDLGGSRFTVDDSGMDLTGGAISGGPQASLSLVFGWWARPEQ